MSLWSTTKNPQNQNPASSTPPRTQNPQNQNPASSTPPRTKIQLSPVANELHPEVILAAQIVLGLFVLIIILFLALPRLQQVESVLEQISKVLGTLDRIVVLLLRLINDLHQIISMADEGFQQVVSVLELIHNVVGSLVNFVNFVVLLLLRIRICRRIWSIWTARQPVIIANDHQNEVPLADAANSQNHIPLTDAEGDAANGQDDVIVNEELNI